MLKLGNLIAATAREDRLPSSDLDLSLLALRPSNSIADSVMVFHGGGSPSSAISRLNLLNSFSDVERALLRFLNTRVVAIPTRNLPVCEHEKRSKGVREGDPLANAQLGPREVHVSGNKQQVDIYGSYATLARGLTEEARHAALRVACGGSNLISRIYSLSDARSLFRELDGTEASERELASAELPNTVFGGWWTHNTFHLNLANRSQNDPVLEFIIAHYGEDALQIAAGLPVKQRAYWDALHNREGARNYILAHAVPVALTYCGKVVAAFNDRDSFREAFPTQLLVPSAEGLPRVLGCGLKHGVQEEWWRDAICALLRKFPDLADELAKGAQHSFDLIEPPQVLAHYYDEEHAEATILPFIWHDWGREFTATGKSIADSVISLGAPQRMNRSYSSAWVKTLQAHERTVGTELSPEDDLYQIVSFKVLRGAGCLLRGRDEKLAIKLDPCSSAEIAFSTQCEPQYGPAADERVTKVFGLRVHRYNEDSGAGYHFENPDKKESFFIDDRNWREFKNHSFGLLHTPTNNSGGARVHYLRKRENSTVL